MHQFIGSEKCEKAAGIVANHQNIVDLIVTKKIATFASAFRNIFIPFRHKER
jgi:hypothetical protein